MNQRTLKYAVALASALTIAGSAYAQAVSAEPQTNTSAPATTTELEETIILTPFEVSSSKDVGYSASTTLAGNRLNTELRDVGSAISVVTEQFMKDIGATDNTTLLQYTTATEVGSTYGNFAGLGNGQSLDESGKFATPNTNTRVRGLSAADNTRDFFMSDIPWDGYNIERVDLQRGPNSILFGQGSPAGIINNSTRGASMKNTGEAELRVDNNGSIRSTVNINRVLLKKQLSLRVTALSEKEKYKQKPAFERDDRIYGALRYEPSFLNKDGVTTTIKFNMEQGDIDANRPRTVTPMDFITPWFMTGKTYVKDGLVVSGPGTGVKEYNNLNQQFFDPYKVWDNNSGTAGHGQMQPALASSLANPAYIPYLGPFAQNYGNPIAAFDGTTGSVLSAYQPEIVQVRGLNKSGGMDGNISFLPMMRQVSVGEYWKAARAMGLRNADYGVYKNKHLTDASIFDFYNNLLDGPNKREWNNFHTANLNIAQTFYQNKFGYEFAYDYQKYGDGKIALLSDLRQGIYVDVMATLADGSANPNKGRAFISDSGQYANSGYSSERESRRFTAFATHDFSKGKKGNFLARAVGKHTLTGMGSGDTFKYDRRSFLRSKADSGWVDFTSRQSASSLKNTPVYTNAYNLVSPVVYLSGNLTDANRTDGSGLHISAPSSEINLSNVSSIRGFDSTWNAPSTVLPGANWQQTTYWGTKLNSWEQNGGWYTQSDNPANYVGWTSKSVSIIRADEGYADQMTTSATLGKKLVSSRGLVWQGHFWDNLLVGNYGIRNDIAKAWVAAPGPDGATGLVNLDRSVYNLDNATMARVQRNSRSWSVVAHLSQLLPDKLPVRFSAFYNESENFQPEASRYDIYGHALPMPKGKTTDKGILISTKDDKYSIKINKFQTKSYDGNISSGVNTWYIGSGMTWAMNWADRYQYNLDGSGIQQRNPSLDVDPTNQWVVSPDFLNGTRTYSANGSYDFTAAPGETSVAALQKELTAVRDFRAFLATLPTEFFDTYRIDNSSKWNVNRSNSFKYGSPVLTEDAVSQGYEVELTANPTSNWRVSFNGAKVEATRYNVGGAAFADFVSRVETAFNTTKAGDLRIWYGGPANDTARTLWYTNIGTQAALAKQSSGTPTPEVRKYRLNLISSYSFKNGMLKGFTAGGGLRWQDKVLLGYRSNDPVNGNVSFDLDHPYYGPAETNVDAWFSYNRNLFKGVNWTIQFNVRNMTTGNKLIPISVQDDGTPAAYRIAPPRVFTLTNTFRF